MTFNLGDYTLIKDKMLKIVFFTFTFLLITLFNPKDALASTLHLSPNSVSIGVGSTRSVQVRLNTGGEAVNAVSAVITYPSDKLDVASITYGGTAFGIAAEGSGGGGAIRISRGSLNAVSGNVNVATINFRGKAKGTAIASFASGSAAPRASDSSDSLSLGGSTGATFNIGAPATQPKQEGQSVASPASADSTKPLISELKVSDVSTNSATVRWKTNERADSTLDFGLEQDKYFLSSTKAFLTVDHSITIQSPLLVPGTKLHFVVKSKDPSGNEVVSDDQEVQLKGYQIIIKVLDNNSRPLTVTQVYLYSEALVGTTDLRGEVTFSDVTPGKHLVVVKSVGFESTKEIEVVQSEKTQNYEIMVKNPGLIEVISTVNPLFIGSGVAGVILLVVLVLVRKRLINIKQPFPPFSN